MAASSFFRHYFFCCGYDKKCDAQKAIIPEPVELIAKPFKVQVSESSDGQESKTAEYELALAELPSKFSRNNPPAKIIALDVDGDI